jgi:hypothetical protein
MVIAVGDGVDDGLSDGIGREFVGGGSGDAVLAGADGTVDLREDEITGLIGLLEEVAAIDLLRGERAAVFGAVTENALGL